LGKKTFEKDTIEYVVLPIVIVFFIFVVYTVQYRLIQANSRLIDALISCSSNGIPDASLYEKALLVDSTTANQEIREQILNCSLRVINAQQAPGPMKQAFFALAMQEIQNQINYAPKDARMYVLGGSFMNGIGQYTEAVPLLEKALELSPRKQSVIYDLATSYLNLNTNIDKAVEIMKGAYESAKTNSQAKISYATTLISANREKEAKELFKDNPSALNVIQIAQAYAVKKQYTKAIEVYKALLKASPNDINYLSQLAQTQYLAGQKYAAIETLKLISADKPELKIQVDEAIKQIERQ
jgi:tetratricopeptide (TPR) repeat protein